MTTVVSLDARDLIRHFIREGYSIDHLEYLVTHYIGDRYTLPTVIDRKWAYPIPVNIPTQDEIAPYIDGAIDSIVNFHDQDSCVSVMLDRDYLHVMRV